MKINPTVRVQPYSDSIGKSSLTTVEDGHRYRLDLPPASIIFNEKKTVANFTCPCGCGGIWILGLRKEAWNYNAEDPTFFFNLKAKLPCKWNGVLREGIFMQCD